MRFILFRFMLIVALQLLIEGHLVKPAAAFRRNNDVCPCALGFKNRILIRNIETRLMDNINGINEENVQAIVDALPSAPAVTLPVVQENQRQGKIYKSYQDFVSYIMKTPIWRDYSLSLRIKPVVTKAFSSMIGYFLCDLLAQLIFRKVIIISIPSLTSIHYINNYMLG